MGIPSASLPIDLRRRLGMEAPASTRKPRGEGKDALRKKAAAERLPMVLALLGTSVLPEGVFVNPFPGKQNGDERRYGQYLTLLQNTSIGGFAFQPIRVRL